VIEKRNGLYRRNAYRGEFRPAACWTVVHMSRNFAAAIAEVKQTSMGVQVTLGIGSGNRSQEWYGIWERYSQD